MSDATHPATARASLPGGRFLVGCCRDPATPGESAAPTPAMEGVAWRLVRLTGQEDAALAAASRPVSVRFESGRVTGFSGCNSLSGGYTLEGDHLVLGQLAGTMMACPEPAMMIENAFKKALSGSQRYEIAGVRLTLTSLSGATLVFTAEPEPALEHAERDVTGFNNGRGGVVSPVTGTALTLSFRDGAVAGDSGCNWFRGAYTRDGDRLTIERLASTRNMCAAEGVMAQERAFLAALEGARRWTVCGDLLDLHLGDGSRALTARMRTG